MKFRGNNVFYIRCIFYLIYSHLGPLLYLIFCNDLPQFVSNVSILMYADDTKLFTRIDTVEDQLRLQRAIDALVQWSERNGLILNSGKTFSLSFSHREIIPFTYTINNTPISTTTSIKDLGVIFDTRLNFREHIAVTGRRAVQMTGVINRLVQDINCPALAIQLFKSFVLPVVEYCSCVWDQRHSSNSLLDASLRAITRLALRLPKFPYNPRYVDFETRLITLKLHTLPLRRQSQLVTVFTKILRGELHAPSNLAVLLASKNNSVPITRRPNYFPVWN